MRRWGWSGMNPPSAGSAARPVRAVTVCYDNADELNVMDQNDAEALSTAMDRVGESCDVRVIVLRGAGECALICRFAAPPQTANSNRNGGFHCGSVETDPDRSAPRRAGTPGACEAHGEQRRHMPSRAAHARRIPPLVPIAARRSTPEDRCASFLEHFMHEDVRFHGIASSLMESGRRRRAPGSFGQVVGHRFRFPSCRGGPARLQ